MQRHNTSELFCYVYDRSNHRTKECFYAKNPTFELRTKRNEKYEPHQDMMMKFQTSTTKAIVVKIVLPHQNDMTKKEE